MTFPVTLELRGHGDLTAHNSQELAAYQNMGWVPRPDTPPAFEMFPMWLKGRDGLPDLLVENAAEAKAAADRGYRLPSDGDVEAAEAAFAASYTEDDEDYQPERYPLRLRHPDHRDAVPMRWSYHPGPAGLVQGTAIPGAPEHLPDVEVCSLAEEKEWAARGWTIGAAEALRGAHAHAHEAPGAPFPSSEAEDRSHASPPSIAATRKRPSGAQWRKRRREQMQAAQPEGSP